MHAINKQHAGAPFPPRRSTPRPSLAGAFLVPISRTPLDKMSLWLAKWPNGDIVVARADGEQEMMELLDEAADPGLACIEEYDGPFCLEFKAKLPGCSLRDEQRYLCPSRAAAEATQQDAVRCELWAAQQAGGTEGGEVQVAAADGSTARAHAAVLRAGGAALKELVGSPAQPQITLPCVPSAAVLHTLLEWLYVSKASFKDTSKPLLCSSLLAKVLAPWHERAAVPATQAIKPGAGACARWPNGRQVAPPLWR